jgi:hypothetical protein
MRVALVVHDKVLRAAIEAYDGRVDGVRPGCAVAVRLDAGHSRESFAVAVESNLFEDPREVRRIKCIFDLRRRGILPWRGW